MPLKHVRSNASKKTQHATQSENIKEMVDAWKVTGHIGNSTPGTKKEAITQAVAASYTSLSGDLESKKKRKTK
jgi:hypothetical protein